jgi:transcriptional regulator with XRE-family HTH domain
MAARATLTLGRVDEHRVNEHRTTEHRTTEHRVTEHRTTEHRELDVPGVLRALRRRADLSQRELAERSGVAPATVASVEAGTAGSPRLRTVEQLVAATGARLAILDIDGSEPTRLPSDRHRDQALRRFPPHVDVYRVEWEGARRVDRIAFLRNRFWRDQGRRDRAGDYVRQDLAYEVRRLGPGDQAVLAALHADASLLDLAGRKADGQPLSDEAAIRYLRDPNLRHWVAQERMFLGAGGWGKVLGHLVAHVHRHSSGRPTVVVTRVGVRPGHREGRIPIQLLAEMEDEAVLLDAGQVLAVPDHPAVARFLRSYQFRPGPRRQPLLTVNW